MLRVVLDVEPEECGVAGRRARPAARVSCGRVEEGCIGRAHEPIGASSPRFRTFADRAARVDASPPRRTAPPLASPACTLPHFTYIILPTL